MQNFKRTQLTPGRWIRIRYDDVGVRDVILLEVGSFAGGTSYRVFEPGNKNGNDSIDYSQIVSIGPFVNVPAF